jgi:hypothetical protein
MNRRVISVPESEIVFAVQESPEGGYEAKALSHAVFKQSKTLEELKATAQEAVRCHFDEAGHPSAICFCPVKEQNRPF